MGNSVMAWVWTSMRPIRVNSGSENQIAPSDPTAMPSGLACMRSRLGSGYSVTFPSGVIRATLSPAASTNHIAPSGPATNGPGGVGPGPWIGPSLVGTAKPVSSPDGVR
jgi:hypothetical protein